MAELYLYDRVATLLSDGKDRGYSDIERELGLFGTAARTAIYRLKREGRVHICDWIPSTTGSHGPIFRFGPGEDVEYQRSVSVPERKRLWRERIMKRDQERLSVESGDFQVSRDPFISILFGAREAIKATALPSRIYRQNMEISETEVA
jgi:hypothetical protein